MFDDLISFSPDPGAVEDFVPFNKATPSDILSAQHSTAEWLKDLGIPPDDAIIARQEQAAAREAFNTLNFSPDTAAQRTSLVAIKTPAAVQHLVGMLTAYDWEFVERAKELRSYTVSKILEETTHPDARIRLKALQMLGNVTEVALFTERVEVTKKDVSEEEIEKRLHERLSKLLTPADGASIKEVAQAVEEAVLVEDAFGLDDEISAVAERSEGAGA
jgi:hypothetical protein